MMFRIGFFGSKGKFLYIYYVQLYGEHWVCHLVQIFLSDP